MVPDNDGVPQLPPVVVTVQLKGEPEIVVGVPEITNVFPDTDAVTPEGKPVTEAPVAEPPKVYSMFVIALLSHRVWLEVATADVSTKVAKG